MSDQDQQAREAFRRHLIASGRDEQTSAELAGAVVLDNFRGSDGAVDTAKLNEFASRFNLSARRTRNYGAGRHYRIVGSDTSDGKSDAERRFGTAAKGEGAADTTWRNPEAERRFGSRS